MNTTKTHRLSLLITIFLLFSVACNQAGQHQAENGTNNTHGSATATSSNPAASHDPRPDIAPILQQCVKVEYALFDLGITFESQSNQEVMRFFSYVSSTPANASCPKEKYDGGIVFKDNNGDIKADMLFNLPGLSQCNRVRIKQDGKEYDVTLDNNGIAFFDQILKLREQAPAGGAGGH